MSSTCTLNTAPLSVWIPKPKAVLRLTQPSSSISWSSCDRAPLGLSGSLRHPGVAGEERGGFEQQKAGRRVKGLRFKTIKIGVSPPKASSEPHRGCGSDLRGNLCLPDQKRNTTHPQKNPFSVACDRLLQREAHKTSTLAKAETSPRAGLSCHPFSCLYASSSSYSSSFTSSPSFWVSCSPTLIAVAVTGKQLYNFKTA